MISGEIVTLAQWVERSRLCGFAVLATLLVASRPNQEAVAGSRIATVPAAAIFAPSNTSSGGIDNGLAGNTFVNCSAGTGLSPHNLVLLGINILSASATISPPQTDIANGHPPWNLIDPETVNGDYTQQYSWHEVGANEAGARVDGGHNTRSGRPGGDPVR